MFSNWAWWTSGGSKNVRSCFLYFTLEHLANLSPLLSFYQEKSSINGIKTSIFRNKMLHILVSNWALWTYGGSKTFGSCLLYFPLEHLANLSPLLSFNEEKPSINGVKTSIFHYETLHIIVSNQACTTSEGWKPIRNCL